MHHLNDVMRLNLEKVAFLEVAGEAIRLIFDNGKEFTIPCESEEQALKMLKEIDASLIIAPPPPKAPVIRQSRNLR
uniref:Uncharacterized protein n=1 Tax=Vibrio splendidus TaxID=29497 RepID=A0A0H3ZVM4_VIBSP|nr:hypothetical protein [Vibrio splendidus]